MHKIPRLTRSRHGVYYLRLTHGKTDTRRSLGTKDFQRAKLSALLLNVHVEMSKSRLDAEMFRHLDIALPNGVKLTNIQPEDKGILFDILDKLGVTGEQLAAMPTAEVAKLLAGPEPQRMEPPKPKSKPLSDVIALYLTEKKLDNVAKTLDDKERTYAEFQGFFQDGDINAFGADTAIAYKNRLLAANASASRINAKTSFLKDLFAYAINNNLYFATNPFEKVRVSSKTKLKQQVESYREFTDDDLKLIFDETSYRGYLRKPDYNWLPFLSLYTGARVEELACLQLDQIKKDKRRLIYEIVAEALRQRVPLTGIAEAVPWRGNVFATEDGQLDEAAFQTVLGTKRLRYFTADDDLFHVDGNTYALSNQWGARTLEAIENILRLMPNKELVSYSPATALTDEVVYGEYLIRQCESGAIEVEQDGTQVQPVKPVLRKLAEQLGIPLQNANGNNLNTRQLGVQVMNAIRSQ